MGTLLNADNNLKVKSVRPGAVSSFLDLKSETYIKKKNSSVALLEKWLEDGVVECSEKNRDMFSKIAKKDDLADCAALCIAYIEWYNNARDFQL